MKGGRADETSSGESARKEPEARVDPARQAGLLVVGSALATSTSALTPLLVACSARSTSRACFR